MEPQQGEEGTQLPDEGVTQAPDAPASPQSPEGSARLVSGPYGTPGTLLSAMIANSQSPRKDAEEIVLNQQMLRIAEDLEDGPYVHRRTAELWDRWTRVLTTWEIVPAESRDRRIKYLIRAGIPNPLRPRMWPLLVDLDQRAQDLVVRYPILLQSMDCEYEEKIMKDLARTFPMHPLFAERGGVGQQKMFNVLKAYAVHDPGLGYCQGMAFVVGILLMKLPEDQAFATLSTIMVDPFYDMHGVYDKSVGKMPFFFYVVDQLIKEYVPEVWEQFQSEGIEASMFATQWFMTLFSQKFPFSIVLRIWDIFLAEGLKILFRVAVALVQTAREELCQLDFVGILTYFRNEIVSIYDTAEAQSALMEVVGGVKIKPKKLKQLEKDFGEKKRLELEAEDPVRRLEQTLKTKEAELNGLQAEKAEAEQVALDMRILMLQTEDVKTTMVTQLQDALAAQADAETRADALEERLRQAGLYTEEYSSAALELKRAANAKARATARSADTAASLPQSVHPLSALSVYPRRSGQIVDRQVTAASSSLSDRGVGSGLGTEAVRRTLQGHLASMVRLNADLTAEGCNGVAAEQIARLQVETEAVLAVIGAAMGGSQASEATIAASAAVATASEMPPAWAPGLPAIKQTASVVAQPTQGDHERAVSLHEGMIGTTAAASLPLTGGGAPPGGDNLRSKSGGGVGTFWGGLSRLSSSGASGSCNSGSTEQGSRDAAISRLEEGKSALQKSTLDLSEALAASEASNAELRKELEDTKELLKNSEQVRSSLLEIVSSAADPTGSGSATTIPIASSGAPYAERAEEERVRRVEAVRKSTESPAPARDVDVKVTAPVEDATAQADQDNAQADSSTNMAKLSMEI